jgi:hypothetical protein
MEETMSVPNANTETAHNARQDRSQEAGEQHQGSYGRFFAMVGTATVIMFGLMYLNTYALGHVFFSETRFYMTSLMGGVMATVMLVFMMGMYRNAAVNIATLLGSAILVAGSLWLVRSQTTVQDVSWLRAMIPHHSITILTSERAEISDPRVRSLADDIIEAQRLEIDEMRALIADLQGGPTATPGVDGR